MKRFNLELSTCLMACSEHQMPSKRSIKLRCPICKKTTKATDPDFPFCSDRCRLIDLGKWASGGYVISSPVNDAEEAVRQDSVEDEDGD